MVTPLPEQYYDLLKDVLDEFDLEHHPEQIYNMDESGVPLDPRPPKVAARKGQRKQGTVYLLKIWQVFINYS